MHHGTRSFASSSSPARVLPAGRSTQVALDSWLVGSSVTLVSFTVPGGSTTTARNRLNSLTSAPRAMWIVIRTLPG
jgi:hypothetical protein